MLGPVNIPGCFFVVLCFVAVVCFGLFCFTVAVLMRTFYINLNFKFCSTLNPNDVTKKGAHVSLLFLFLHMF